MDEFGKYIWLILGIIYFLFGRGKEKEEKGKPRPAAEPRKRSKPLQDILKELSEEIKDAQEGKGQPDPRSTRPVQPEPVRSRKKIKIEKHNENFEDLIEHRVDTGDTIENIREKMDSEEYRHMHKEQGGLEIDLKQAIIYDAIMNRPYD